MLAEIQCDKFISHGEPRGPIRFHYGLNAVLGDDNGSNSIGKSTFLMILDFVFGGVDYINRCPDVQTNVKEQTIKFKFIFEGEPYYFSRNTVDYKVVTRCYESYQPVEDNPRLTLDEYKEFLRSKYGLNTEGLTWRGAVSRFIRVYKRDTLDEERPLRSSKDEKTGDTVKRYMMLFDRYAAVAAQIKQAAAADEEKEAFRKTRQYDHIRAAEDDKEFETNEARIKELQDQEKQLAAESNQGLLSLDSIQAQRLTELRDQQVDYRRQMYRVMDQLNRLRRDMMSGKRSFKRSYDDLARFFPGVEFKKLEEIENFHKKLSKVLNAEYRESEKSLSSTYVLLRNQLAAINDQIAEIKNIPNVSEAILKEYAKITTELSHLQEANKNYETYNGLVATANEYAQTRDAVTSEQLNAIETAVNQQMRDITLELIKEEGHLPPVLRMLKLNSYTFNTPNDGGTGAQYRGVITFDLANLALTPLPLIVHDSVMLKNIERPVLEQIFLAYDRVKEDKKQVFMAYDALDAYSKETQDLLYENCVLHLSKGGDELFGWAWNKSTNGNSGAQE